MNKDTIYSENFKRWFGDWENDPQNSSKVVDKDGKPLPVEHGSVSRDSDGKCFKVFKVPCHTSGIMFTDSRSISSRFADNGRDPYVDARFCNFDKEFEKWSKKDTIEGLVEFLNVVMDEDAEIEYDDVHIRLYTDDRRCFSYLGKTKEEAYQNLYKKVQRIIQTRAYLENGKNGYIYKVFLNIRNPYVFDAQGDEFWRLSTEFNKQSHITVVDLVDYVKDTGRYDGVIIRNVRETPSRTSPSTNYIVFKPNQIKHALDNNGNFNADNDDITEGKRNVENNIKLNENKLRRIIQEAVRQSLLEIGF